MSLRIIPLTDPDHGPAGHRLAWLAARPDGIPLGSAFLRLFNGAERSHLAELDVQVHPSERRDGVGSGLLAAAVVAAREDGRRSVLAHADEASAGDLFLQARGLRRVLTLTYARLPLDRADPAALAALVERPHPGYRLTSWDGVVPDELAASYVASRRAMDDMPMGDADYGRVSWDLDRILAAAHAVQKRGDLLHTVAAVDASDGSVAGFTELVVPGDGRGDAQHYGTGVLPEHRGHGLGLWMKAEAVRQARERHPGLGGLLTDTAEDNTPMRSVNDTLGYAPTHRTVMYQLDL